MDAHTPPKLCRVLHTVLQYPGDTYLISCESVSCFARPRMTVPLLYSCTPHVDRSSSKVLRATTSAIPCVESLTPGRTATTSTYRCSLACVHVCVPAPGKVFLFRRWWTGSRSIHVEPSAGVVDGIPKVRKQQQQYRNNTSRDQILHNLQKRR